MKLDQLMEAAFVALNAGDLKIARKLARELLTARHTAGFEILGRVYQQENKTLLAIKILENGVNEAPSIWVLWKLLADSYSNASRFRAAEDAYQKSLRCRSADPDLIHLNRGIAFRRAKKFREAESALRKVRASRLRRLAEAELIHIALDTKRPRAACARANSLAAKPGLEEESYGLDTIGRIFRATALGFIAGKKFAKARERALLAVELNDQDSEALAIIREIDDVPAKRSQGFNLILRGRLDQPVGRQKNPPFFRNIQVVAPDLESAIRYAANFFSGSVESSLKLEEHSLVDSSKADLEGVYRLSGYFIYPSRGKTLQ